MSHHIAASLIPMKGQGRFKRLATSQAVINQGSTDQPEQSGLSNLSPQKAKGFLVHSGPKKLLKEFTTAQVPPATIDDLKKGLNPDLISKCLIRESTHSLTPSQHNYPIDPWVLQNYFNCLVCTTASSAKSSPSFIVGEGNNHQLVGKHFANMKPLGMISFYNRASIIWTPLKLPKKPPITTDGPKVTLEAVQKWKDFSRVSATEVEQLTRQLLDMQIFKVANQQLVREVFEHTVHNSKSVHLVVREDFVITNHVNDLKDISRKSLLFLTIQNYLNSEQGKRDVGSKTVIPLTYLLNGSTFDADLEAMIQDKEDRDFKFETPLIIKPGQFSNRGIGISIAFSMSEAVRLCKETLEFKKNTCSVIVQEYITRPLLFKERKFDIRCYALVVRLFDRISYYWYSRGYVRTSSFAYDPNVQDNLKVHLTNEAVQVKDAKTFGKFEPGNKVYYGEMDEYFAQDPRFADKPKLFSEELEPEFKARALIAFKASSEAVAREPLEVGFELLGFDFMVDDALNVYLIEVNTNPCLSTLSEPQGVLINKLLADTIRLVLVPVYGLSPKEDLAPTGSSSAETKGYLTDYELIYNYFYPSPSGTGEPPTVGN